MHQILNRVWISFKKNHLSTPLRHEPVGLICYIIVLQRYSFFSKFPAGRFIFCELMCVFFKKQLFYPFSRDKKHLYRLVTSRCVPLRISGQKFPWSSADFFVNLQQEKEEDDD